MEVAIRPIQYRRWDGYGENRVYNGTIDMGSDEFLDTDGDGTADYDDADDDDDGILDGDEVRGNAIPAIIQLLLDE